MLPQQFDGMFSGSLLDNVVLDDMPIIATTVNVLYLGLTGFESCSGRSLAEVSKKYYILFVIFLVLLALGLWQGEYLMVYVKARLI